MELNDIEKMIKRSRWFAISIFVIAIGGYVIWFWLIQKQPLSDASQSWGTFGDFIGGLLNPIIAYLAFYWLTISVLVQKSELNETRTALVSSSKSQESHAQQAKLDAQIQAKNILFQKINTGLQGELAYRNAIISNSSLPDGTICNVINKTGDIVSIYSELAISNEIIQKLATQQHEIVEQINALLIENKT